MIGNSRPCRKRLYKNISMLVEKRNNFTNDIIFIDGLWGTGKSLIEPIVSGMSGVEQARIDSIFEYVCGLFHLGKINHDGAIWLLRTYADALQYNNTIGREVNLRWQDHTGLKNSLHKKRLVKRMFGSEGDLKVDEINDNNLAFCVMSHMLMLTPDLLSAAYGNRVRVIEMVRHPLYMLSHFTSYLSNFESPREYTISFYHDETKIPWFLKGVENEFIHANPTERAVLCVTRLYPWLDKSMIASRAAGLAVLDLSFEMAAFETKSTLDKLECFIGRKHHNRILSILKSQKIPRAKILDGKGFKRYGWSKSCKSEEDVYKILLSTVNDKCSGKLQDDMVHIINWYNAKYPSRLNVLAKNLGNFQHGWPAMPDRP